MEKIINLLFWGFLSKPWKRLFRTISVIFFVSLMSNMIFNSNDYSTISILTFIVFLIPLFSYVTEPFINKVLPKSGNYKKDGHDLIVTEKRTGINMTDDEVREVGRKFLDELKEKGPDLSRVGQTFVRTTNTPLTETKGEEFDDESKIREFRKLRIDIMKEFPKNFNHMVNNSYNVVSFVSNEKGTETTSLVYDLINKRVIEKWLSYQLVSDESNFIITNRYIYIYNKYNLISNILEVEKGHNDRQYDFLSDHTEYCHNINRTIKKLDLNNKFITYVHYTRNNHVGSKGKIVFIKTLNLLTKEVGNGVLKTRMNYLLKGGKLFKYFYKKNDFCFLRSIIEYKVLIDLRFINLLINKTGIPILMSLPDLFLKIKTKITTNISDNKEVQIKYYKQDYFSSYYLRDDNFDFFIQNLIQFEDLFINEKNNIHQKYNKER